MSPPSAPPSDRSLPELQVLLLESETLHHFLDRLAQLTAQVLPEGSVEHHAAVSDQRDFSSIHNTTDLSGGFKYRPTTSISFSSKTSIIGQCEGLHQMRLEPSG